MSARHLGALAVAAATATLVAAHPQKVAAKSAGGCPQGANRFSFGIEAVKSTGYHRDKNGNLVFGFAVKLRFNADVFVMVSFSGLGVDKSKSLNRASTEPYTFEVNSHSQHFPAPPYNTVDFGFLSGCLESGHMSLKLNQTDQPNSDDSVCPNFEVIDLRGSGAPAGEVSLPGEAFYKELKNKKPNEHGVLVESSYRATGGLFRLIGAALVLPTGYHHSVVDGKKQLKNQIDKLVKRCPDTLIYLVGYSQGAQVAGDVYQAGAWQQVAGVVLFGDPYFNNLDKAADRGNYQRGLSGALGTRPLFSGLEEGHVLSYCHRYDPVCQGPLNYAKLAIFGFRRHENYGVGDEPVAAADYFAQR